MAEQRAERRLTVIQASDIVGYSRLMEADEAGTLAQLRTLRRELLDPKLAEYGGRLVKTTGDGVLAEFASAVDAVEHAIAVQDALARRNADVPPDRRIVFRFGVNIGDVVVEGDDIYGDGVNVAARLEALAEPGSVYLSDDVRRQVAGKIKADFDDLGEQSLKNIARPVRIYRIAAPDAGDAGPAADTAAPGLSDKPSIAVLPFENMSGDPEQAYFSDGITEDIITELSRFRSLFVIARNSSFAFKGQNVDVAEIGRRLGVQYVVEGSVRKAGGRVRVTAQLIDAATGRHRWAERYDRDLEDIFAVQDELTQAIVSILPGRLEDADRERAESKRTPNMTAYDCVLLGNEHLRQHTREEIAEARRWYRKAIELDPRYARAHALLSWTHCCDAAQVSWKLPSVTEALKSAETALALDETDSWTHGVMGQTLMMLGRDQEAEIHFRRASALNPNDAEVAALWAPMLVYLGRWREGLDWIEKARRLNPYPGRWYHWYRGFALYSARDYEQAITAFKEISVVNIRSYAYLAACYAQLDKPDEASAPLAQFAKGCEAERLKFGDHLPATDGDVAREWAERYRKPEDREHLLDGLRKAGLSV